MDDSTLPVCGELWDVATAGCGGGKRQLVVAFSQANNAEPYRAAQNGLMTRLFAPDPDIRLAISDAQQDNSRQVAQVETIIRQKPDLLIGPLSRDPDRGRSSGRLDPGQSQRSHDGSSACATAYRRSVRP